MFAILLNQKIKCPDFTCLYTLDDSPINITLRDFLFCRKCRYFRLESLALSWIALLRQWLTLRMPSSIFVGSQVEAA